MFGLKWRAFPGLRAGDWRSKLIAVSQALIGFVALLSTLAMLTRDPLMLLGVTAAQWLILVGVILYVVVAIFAQRTLVLEEFGPGEVIFRAGDHGLHVYVIKSGTVEVLAERPDGSQEVIRRLGSGDHFGEMALLRKAPRSATVRTVTPVQVFRMSPSNFTALYTSMPGFRDHFHNVMQSRLRDFEPRK
jgi:hypothetical protein